MLLYQTVLLDFFFFLIFDIAFLENEFGGWRTISVESSGFDPCLKVTSTEEKKVRKMSSIEKEFTAHDLSSCEGNRIEL